jgi:hypothetical protein
MSSVVTETVFEKSRRLLVEGRLTIEKVEDDLIVASCRGDSGTTYHLGHDPSRPPHWRCTCPAKTTCSHLRALWLVTQVPHD